MGSLAERLKDRSLSAEVLNEMGSERNKTDVEIISTFEAAETQGDLTRSLKREIKTLKSKVIAQDIRIFEMQALLQSGKGLSNILDLPRLLDTFMAVVRERYDVVTSCVFLKEDIDSGEKEFFQIKRYFGLDDYYVDVGGRREPLFLFRIEKNNGLLWQLIQQGNVFSVRDLQKEPRFITAWERSQLDVLRSDFWCPLIKSGEVIGILMLGEKRDGTQVSEGEFDFVQELASIATTIIDSTLKYEKNQRILRNIQILYEVHQQLANINDQRELCYETIRRAVKAVNAQKGNLMLFNKQTGKLEFNVGWGFIDEAVVDAINDGRIETKSFELGEGIAGHAAVERRPIVVNNREDIPQVGSFETYCMCSIPVINGGNLEGVMNFTNKVHINEQGQPSLDVLGRFTREDISLLQGIADQSAVSLHKSRLYSASITDRLTGLHNTRYFEDTYHEYVAKAMVEDRSLCLAVLDIDHFKQFNDKYGHKFGDQVLRAVAQELDRFRRPNSMDVAYRYGGEEFALVMPDASLEEARDHVEKFRAAVEALKLEFDGKPVGVTVTAGLGQTKVHARDSRHLFATVDEALYEGKRSGRNRVQVAQELKDVRGKQSA